MADRFDIVGIGCAAVDDLFYVDRYPSPDSKTRANRSERKIGGLTAAALLAAARLGSRCAFAGLLGKDELSKAVEDEFATYGVSTEHVVRRSDASPVRAVVIVAGASRTLVYDPTAPVGADVSGPGEEVIANAKVLFVDHIGIDGGNRAVEIASRHRIPIVADFEEEVGAAMEKVDHLVLCESFAMRLTGASDACQAAKALWSEHRAAVVVTRGAEGCVFIGSDQPAKIHEQAAIPVEATDTTGCGDVFHGAYSCSLARGDSIAERIAYATSAAACRAATGRFPSPQDVASMLRRLAT